MSQINNYGTTPNNIKTTTVVYCLFPPVGKIQNFMFVQTETIHSKDREMSKVYTSSHVGGISQGSNQREGKPTPMVMVGTGTIPGRVSFWSPLPRISAKYHPLPASRLMSSFQPKQKALSSPQKEEEVGFTGCRMNSKMQVFSGSKCAYLAKMMTLRQQCIWVLKNNINSIFKVGGVPYSVLEPILKSCAPDQLYRIEKYNHTLVQETDQLWKIHCHQNFRKERPQEHESWREMYMRLQDAQEQRLRALTVTIQSAHANKPKGRQAKMILLNSLARPPSDVQRREQFETREAAVPEKVKIKPAPYPRETSHTPSSSNSLNLTQEKLAHTCSSTTSTH